MVALSTQVKCVPYAQSIRERRCTTVYVRLPQVLLRSVPAKCHVLAQ